MAVAYAAQSTHSAFSAEHWHAQGVVPVSEQVAEETPVALAYNGESFAVMMATPQDLEDFALGFSVSEGIVANRDGVGRTKLSRHPEGVVLDVAIDDASFAALRARQRNLTGRTGCGLCGVRSLAQAIAHPRALTRQHALTHQAVERAVTQLGLLQPINAVTGALHAAGWAKADGEIVCVREDVGRHNALDKLIGALVARDTDLNTGFVVMTSRASYELIQKAAQCGISALAAVSAPTALAIRLAQEVGLCLIAYARPGRHTVYANAQRVVDAVKSEAA